MANVTTWNLVVKPCAHSPDMTLRREEKQRESGAIILKIMAIIMVMSAVSMGYAAVLEVQRVIKHPELAWKFGHICGDGATQERGLVLMDGS